MNSIQSGCADIAPIGTTIKFNPPSDSNAKTFNGVRAAFGARHQCITSMKDYKDKSLEELRVEDYVLNNKGRAAAGMTFGATNQSVGIFSATTPAISTSVFTLGGNIKYKSLGSDESSNGVIATATGTTIKFNPISETDMIVKGGVSTSVPIKLQCITCMKEYKNKSLEELRFEDYAANHNGEKANENNFGGTHRPINSFLCMSSPSTSSFTFGNTTQSKSLFSDTTALPIRPFPLSSASTSVSRFCNTRRRKKPLNGINTTQPIVPFHFTPSASISAFRFGNTIPSKPLFGTAGNTSGFIGTSSTGTISKFNSSSGTDIKNEVSASFGVNDLCNCCREKYENRILEKLHKDYAANHTDGTAAGVTAGTATQPMGFFGPTSAAFPSVFKFGKENMPELKKNSAQRKPLFDTTTGTTNIFGQPAENKNFGLFGKLLDFGSSTTQPVFRFGCPNTAGKGTSLGQNNQQNVYSRMADYDDFYGDIDGDAPCEFCGESFPLVILIEHESACRPDLVHYNFNAEYVLQESIITSNSKNVDVAENISHLNINEEKVEAQQEPKKESEQYQTTVDVGNEREQFKEYRVQQTELSNGKQEKLLSYYTDPEKESENEKEIYKMLENVLTEKKKDMVDINSLSDDDCNESLEEFWKRASDMLKRERNKKKSILTCN